jgi:hypothetical protein
MRSGHTNQVFQVYVFALFMKQSFMKLFGLLAILILVSGCQAIGQADTCAVSRAETERLLSLNFEQFDQDPKDGWRALGNRRGCEVHGARLIEAYIERHQKDIPAKRVAILNWHLGQMWASAGATRKAIVAFEATKPEGGDAQNYYADATIAFLKRDRKAFDQARAGLAALPPPKNWDKAVADYEKRFTMPGPVWPMNLDVVDRLGACFDQPYWLAYSGACFNALDPPAPATAHKP